MKLTIVGAGSTYTPGLMLRWLETKQDRIPLSELCLYDVDPARLETLANFIKGMLAAEAPHVSCYHTTDLKQAVKDASFVIVQMRVGKNTQRKIDEHLCVKHGFIGQETIGPAGFALGLRQVPVGVEVAQTVAQYAPQAWIVSVANPASLLAGALLRHGHEKTIGMCHGGYYVRSMIGNALDVDPERIDFDYMGLNHLGWYDRIYLDGKPLLPEEITEVAAKIYEGWKQVELSMDAEFARDFTPPFTNHHYMTYFYYHDEAVEEQRREEKTRADAVLEIEKACLRYYQEEAGKQFMPPEVLSKRGGNIEYRDRKQQNYGAIGYSDGCLGTIDALLHPEPQHMVVNVLNQGAIADLPRDACVEISAFVHNVGVRRFVLGNLPTSVRGQVAAIEAYERMTVEAALSGDRKLALQALLSHPICHCHYRRTKALLEDLLEANREYLPRFFASKR